MVEGFIPYPDISQRDFVDILIAKKEFKDTAYGSDFQYETTERLCSKGEFRIQPHQAFARNFVSPETPYNGALLFHGTGVGKTCAAISITEGLRDYVGKSGKKIYILSSENIRPNFKKALYDEDRERVEKEYQSMPGSFQCAGNRYYIDAGKDRPKKISSLIKKYYDFYGFKQFANYVDIGLGADSPRNEKGDFIKPPKVTNEDGSLVDIGEFFSNSVIVIDEAHGIASNDDRGDGGGDGGDETDPGSDGESSKKSKGSKGSKGKGKGKGSKAAKAKAAKAAKAKKDADSEDAATEHEEGDIEVERTRGVRVNSEHTLLKVLTSDTDDYKGIIAQCRRYGGKLKIILLTATPMKDQPDELSNLLELLNMNDGIDLKVVYGPSWRTDLFHSKITSTYNSEDIDNAYDTALLKKIAKGYVSYVKGDNPITFPKPLAPTTAQYQLEFLDNELEYDLDDPMGRVLSESQRLLTAIMYEPGHFKDPLDPESGVMLPYASDENVNIMSEYNIAIGTTAHRFRFDLVNCPMELYQFQAYTALRRMSKENRKLDTSDNKALATSIITFPLAGRTAVPMFTEDDVDSICCNSGFVKVFVDGSSTQKISDKKVKKWPHYTVNDTISAEYGHWLRLENPAPGRKRFTLSYFSNKLAKFVQFVNRSPGIAYCYSQAKDCGAVIAALALEANGYLRYVPGLHAHIGADGRPNKDIMTKFPQCRLLHYKGSTYTVDGLDTLTNYRCAYCGNLFNDCTKATDPIHPDKKFKVATYVIVTGSLGSIADINNEAMIDNKRGDKVKAIIGTAVTGQGVDLKWVRQVHILEPWHNNTRIYQAIGRGLRHCSHADLPADQRDVTIFRYSSSPFIHDNNEWIGKLKGKSVWSRVARVLDSEVYLETTKGDEIPVGFTYRDLLTETVDEHTYHRVARKDILIKHIERRLKESAMDCELNKQRNQFQTDLDYSRNCDYDKCTYSCDLKRPLTYVRRLMYFREEKAWAVLTEKDEIVGDVEDKTIAEYYKVEPSKGTGTFHDIPLIRQDIDGALGTNPSNRKVWDYYKGRSHMVIQTGEGQELLLDLASNVVDRSTYDIYFTEPQVDKAASIIARFMQDLQARDLKKIVYLVKQADPLLDETFIYMAVNKLVGSPPSILPIKTTDKFGRPSVVMEYSGKHGTIYFMEPRELQNQHMPVPMKYRQQPVDLKTRHYPMDVLAPPEVAKEKAVEAALETDKLDKQIANFFNVPIRGAYLSFTKLAQWHVVLDDCLMVELAYILEESVVRYARDEDRALNMEYLLEYYLRSGLLYMFDEIGDIPTTVSNGLLAIRSPGQKEFQLGHVMNIITPQVKLLKVSSKSLEWGRPMNISEVPGLLIHLNGSNDDKKYDQLYYPSVDRSELQIYPELNYSITEEKDVYGLMSTPAHRKQMDIRDPGNGIFRRVARHFAQFPTRLALGKIDFKLMDQIHQERLKTAGQKNSKRADLRGATCTTMTMDAETKSIDHINNLLEYGTLTVPPRGEEKPGHYVTYIEPFESEYAKRDDFLADLFRVKIPRRNDREKMVCNKMELILRTLDYYVANGKKWFLNPIDVEFYRPPLVTK